MIENSSKITAAEQIVDKYTPREAFDDSWGGVSQELRENRIREVAAIIRSACEQHEELWAQNWRNKINVLLELISDLRPVVKARACERPCDGGDYYGDLLGRIEAALAIPGNSATLPHEKN